VPVLRGALLEIDPEVERAAVAVDGAEPVDARLQRPEVERIA
jgi:hypothetical protein